MMCSAQARETPATTFAMKETQQDDSDFVSADLDGH